MALSRLSTMIQRAFLENYLDPADLQRKMPPSFDVSTSDESKGVKRIYARNKALTLFVKPTQLGDLVFNGLEAGDCFEVRYAHRDDKDHNQFHASVQDYEESHSHILKGSTPPHQDISENDLRCIIMKMRKFQKENGLCDGGKTDCLITNKDSKNILAEYHEFEEQKKARLNIIAAKKVYAELERKFIAGVESFTHAFLMTLIEKYLQPYLITYGLNTYANRLLIEGLKSSITLMMSHSLINTAFDAIVRNALSPVLNAVGINPSIAEKMVTEIGTVLAFTENPLSIIDTVINGTAAAAGQAAAFKIIHALPKLKKEPKIDNEVTVAVAVSRQLPIGLTRRSIITE